MKHISPTAAELASHVGERLLDEIDEILAGGAQAHIALTGGTLGIKILAALAESPSLAMIDWNAVHFWWSDERYLAPQNADRNETQAKEALLDQLPIPSANVHPMPAFNAPTDTPETGAIRYGEELRQLRRTEQEIPIFDIALLGMGPDGHIASLFPGKSHVNDNTHLVVAVHDSPKPPPTRISLTGPVLQAAEQIWLTVAGQDKARAVALAMTASPVDIPAALVATLEHTTWFLDEAAASDLA